MFGDFTGVCVFVVCSLFWLRFCCWVLCYVALGAGGWLFGCMVFIHV